MLINQAVRVSSPHDITGVSPWVFSAVGENILVYWFPLHHMARDIIYMYTYIYYILYYIYIMYIIYVIYIIYF